MPNRSSKKGKKLDLNELATSITQEATSDQPADTTNNGWSNEGGAVPEVPPVDPPKNPAAVALGRLGGLKGGKARAKKMSKKQRSEAAQKAANVRWKNKK